MKKSNFVINLVMVSILALAGAPCFSQQESSKEGTSLTVYTDNFAVVRQARNMEFKEGVNTLKFTDVASQIDPTSVNFTCLSKPGAISILEQNYEYDLVNSESLLKKCLDKEVDVELKGAGSDAGKATRGVLLAATDGDLIVKIVGGIIILSKADIQSITPLEMPGDLLTRPTLVWLAAAEKDANELCQVTYTTEGIGWKADYSAILNAEEKAVDFSGWVTIDNKSGAEYKDARIKLIAGDVRRIQPPRPVEMMAYSMPRSSMAKMEAAGFEEKPFMEYHLYTLGRASTINNNQVKQIEFIEPAMGVEAKKLLIYEREKKVDKVQVKIEFENTEKNHLGIALPKGKVRVFKKDPADGTLEFVGEDQIDHTARKEKVSLYIGDSFDVVPEYTLVDSYYQTRMNRLSHKIEFRNRKQEAVTVFVDEKFPQGVNWSIDKANMKYEKRDARTARFEVKLEADSTATVLYTVTQTW